MLWLRYLTCTGAPFYRCFVSSSHLLNRSGTRQQLTLIISDRLRLGKKMKVCWGAHYSRLCRYVFVKLFRVCKYHSFPNSLPSWILHLVKQDRLKTKCQYLYEHVIQDYNFLWSFIKYNTRQNFVLLPLNGNKSCASQYSYVSFECVTHCFGTGSVHFYSCMQ